PGIGSVLKCNMDSIFGKAPTRHDVHSSVVITPKIRRLSSHGRYRDSEDSMELGNSAFGGTENLPSFSRGTEESNKQRSHHSPPRLQRLPSLLEWF
ncbi:hypothetical protein GCK32_020719, partial [Trichostrongylus colubriformis]